MSFVNVTGACAPPFACPLRRAGDDSTPATKNPDNASKAVRMVWYCTGRFYRTQSSVADRLLAELAIATRRNPHQPDEGTPHQVDAAEPHCRRHVLETEI